MSINCNFIDPHQNRQRTLFCLEHVCLHDWLIQVQQLSQYLQQQPQQQWLLFEPNISHFSTHLFALLCANKQVVLPPSDKPEQLQSIVQNNPDIQGSIGTATTDKLMHINSDEALLLSKNEAKNQRLPNDITLHIKPTATIAFFTSGSSGTAKKIAKAWSQLETEINELDRLWGQSLQGTTIIATVSHQHVYGLLFRLLWPLLKSYAIDTQLIHYPESLVEKLDRYQNKLTLVSSPAFLARTAEQPLWSQYKQQLAQLFSSGGPLTQQVNQHIAQALNFGPIEVYGSTETGGIAWRNQFSHGPAWQPFAPINIRIGEDQRLAIQSPYLEAQFHQQQWYLTDDRAELLTNKQNPKKQVTNKQFQLLGRADRIVKIEEKRLSLDKLEHTLLQHPWVKNCHSLVLQASRQQIAVVVVLTPTGEQALSEQTKHQINQQLRNFLSNSFETVLLPRKWRYAHTIAVNSQGKLIKQDIVALFN